MKFLLASHFIACISVITAAACGQKVLWVANCGDTVGALPAGMGDTFKALNSAVVSDINSIYAGSTYTVAYAHPTTSASWSYTTRGGNRYLVSPTNSGVCTQHANVGGVFGATTAVATTQSSSQRQITSVPLSPTWATPVAAVQTRTLTGTAPDSAQNVVYWGQHGGGVPENELAAFCTREAGIDIIVLAFLFKYGNGNVIPSGSFGYSCTIGEGQQCDSLAKAIETCKSNGIKVIVSLGGNAGDYSLSSKEEAEKIGQNLWDAYGNSNKTGSVPRPFGKTFVDGWDFNIEHNSGSKYYEFLIASLRSNFASDPGNKYLITGAPQCPIPEPNMGDIISRAKFDYLWVQFYNNHECSVNGGINYDDWTRTVANTPSANAKIFIGVPAHPHAANGQDSGAIYYLQPRKLARLVGQYRSDPAFGGIMIWAAGLSDANANNGCSYAQEAKRILTYGKVC